MGRDGPGASHSRQVSTSQEKSMIDHIGVRVSDYARSKKFYERALKPLGYAVIMEFEDSVAGLGANRTPDLWIAQQAPLGPVHVAIQTADRAAVDAFHAAAIAAGGRDNGAPGLRPDYHPNYYGAFVLDPDGNNVEAVCHKPG
jgi:catechol 2,3-dioxygenase-like lactoylglutathione lyase family enzyme